MPPFPTLPTHPLSHTCNAECRANGEVFCQYTQCNWWLYILFWRDHGKNEDGFVTFPDRPEKIWRWNPKRRWWWPVRRHRLPSEEVVKGYAPVGDPAWA